MWCALPQRGFTFDSARLASATQPTLGNGCRQGATHNVGCTFFRPHHYPSKRNRRGGAYVPARTFAQRRFHTKNMRIVCGDFNDGMRPCRATRAGTQAPPLPRSVIFFHTIPYKQNNHLRTILPNDINHPNKTHKQSPPQQSGAEMHRALPPPQL